MAKIKHKTNEYIHIPDHSLSTKSAMTVMVRSRVDSRIALPSIPPRTIHKCATDTAQNQPASHDEVQSQINPRDRIEHSVDHAKDHVASGWHTRGTHGVTGGVGIGTGSGATGCSGGAA